MKALRINISPTDGPARIALEHLDHDLGVMNTSNGTGAIFAQLFPKITKTGRVLSLEMQVVVLDHDAAKQVKSLMQDAAGCCGSVVECDELLTCPFCEGEKCINCDMGDNVRCMACENEGVSNG